MLADVCKAGLTSALNKLYKNNLSSLYQGGAGVTEGALDADAQYVFDNILEFKDMFKEQGIDGLSSATALLTLASVIMWDSEPRHKCEIWADFVEQHAEMVKNCNPSFFSRKTIGVIPDHKEKDQSEVT